MRLKKSKQSEQLDDEAFFLHFYEENKGFLFFMAQKYTGNTGECEDIVQETLVRLLKNIHTLRELYSNRTFKYIALTVRSAFLDIQRKKHPEQEISVDDLEVFLSEEKAFEQSDDPVSVHMEVMLLKDSLSSRDWQVLEGRYILGYSYEELSMLMGLTQENTRMIVSRAKGKARKLLLSGSGKGGKVNEE